MALGFGYALAGGLASAGGAYAEEQEKQRQFKLDEKASEAELLRKQNFARFQSGLRTEEAVAGEKRALETYGKKKEIDQGFEKSEWVTKDGSPISKGELAKRGNTEGLVRADEYKASRTGELKRSEQAKSRKEELARAEAQYGKDSTKYKQVLAKQFGLTTSEGIGEMTPAEGKKFLNSIGGTVLKVAKADSPTGSADEADKAYTAMEMFTAMTAEQQRLAQKSPAIKGAFITDKLADAMLEHRAEGLSQEEARKKGIGGKSLSKKQFEMVKKYLIRRGDLVPQGAGLGILRPGEFVDRW